MAIDFTCPGCVRPLALADRQAGQRSSCPHCGEPFVVPGGATAIEDFEPARMGRTRPRASSPPWLLAAGISAAVIVGLGILVAALAAVAPRKSNAVDAAEAALEVTAGDLTSSYRINALYAEKRYKGRMLRVSGVVESINSDLLGTPFVTLEADGFGGVECTFEGDEQLLALWKGQSVVIEGRCSGQMMLVLVNDCRVVAAETLDQFRRRLLQAL